MLEENIDTLSYEAVPKLDWHLQRCKDCHYRLDGFCTCVESKYVQKLVLLKGKACEHFCSKEDGARK